MLSTSMSYRLIARDIDTSLARVANQAAVKRESDYFRANIGKIKSPEEFVKNTRLFNYAMKASGLADMAYAKAFMLKAMKEGVDDPESFANKLTDKRYAEFVKTFNFAALGEEATSYNVARDSTVKSFTDRVTAYGLIEESAEAKAETAYFKANIGSIQSIDELLGNSRLLTYAMQAFSIEGLGLDHAALTKLLEGGVADPDSPANAHDDENVAKFVAAFDFAAMGESTTTHVTAVDDTIAGYLRQTLEENAGDQNEGVRLALYFQRKASTIKSFYSVLSDPALAQVVRTALGFPDSMAQADIDRQVAAMEKRIDIEDFQDPEKLAKFLSRFSAMWDVSEAGATTVTSPALTILSASTGVGISSDTLMAIATLKNR